MTRAVPVSICLCDDRGTRCGVHEPPSTNASRMAAIRAGNENAILRALGRFDVANAAEVHEACAVDISGEAVRRILSAMVADGRVVLVRKGVYRVAA